jgi:hypothetical protein
MNPVWSEEAWTTFQEEVRTYHRWGLRDVALRKRIRLAMEPLYASAAPSDRDQVYDEAMRFLVDSGILPPS